MKPFKLYIYESLTPKQAKIVDKWKQGDTSFSDHVFGKKGHTIQIPLEHPDIEPHPHVREHLEKHGYSIDDYRGGYAKDPKGRKVSIGKALNKTKAEKHVTHAFLTDSRREASQQSDLVVHITRHKHGVAEMSTNKGWTSCMNLEVKGTGQPHGFASDYLPNELQAGTHVAYLGHRDDTTFENPVARISLKPYRSIHGDGHTILRPEVQSYGHGGDAFSHTVRKWTEDNFPTKEAAYQRAPGLYDDGASEFTHNPEKIDDIVKKYSKSHPQVVLDAIKHGGENVRDEHFHHIKKHGSLGMFEEILDHPKLPRQYIDEGMKSVKDDSFATDRELVKLSKNPNLTASDIHGFIDAGHAGKVRTHPKWNRTHTDNAVYHAPTKAKDLENMIAIGDNLESKDIDHLLNRFESTGMGHEYFHRAVVNSYNRHGAITGDHITRLLNNRHEDVGYSSLFSSKHLSHLITPDHIHQFIKSGSSHTGVVNHPAFNSEHADAIMNGDNPMLKMAVLASPHATEKHFEQGLASDDSHVFGHAIRYSPHIPADKMYGYLKEDAMNASFSPSLKTEHIEHVMNNPDDHPFVSKSGLMAHANSTKEQRVRGIKSGDYDYAEGAVAHADAGKEEISAFEQHHSPRNSYPVALKALATNKHTSPEYIHRIATEGNDYHLHDVRHDLIKHPNVTRETLHHLLWHSSADQSHWETARKHHGSKVVDEIKKNDPWGDRN